MGNAVSEIRDCARERTREMHLPRHAHGLAEMRSEFVCVVRFRSQCAA